VVDHDILLRLPAALTVGAYWLGSLYGSEFIDPAFSVKNYFSFLPVCKSGNRPKRCCDAGFRPQKKVLLQQGVFVLGGKFIGKKGHKSNYIIEGYDDRA